MRGNDPEVCGRVQATLGTIAGLKVVPGKRPVSYLVLFFFATGCDSFVIVSAHLRPLPRSFLASASRCHEPGRDYYLHSAICNSK